MAVFPSYNTVSYRTGSSDAGSWTPHDEDGVEEDIPDTPESLPPYPNSGKIFFPQILVVDCFKAKYYVIHPEFFSFLI